MPGKLTSLVLGTDGRRPVQLRRECGFNGSSQQQQLEKMHESSGEMELEKDSMGGPGGGEVLAGGPPTLEESPQQEFEHRISCGRTRDDGLGASKRERPTSGYSNSLSCDW